MPGGAGAPADVVIVAAGASRRMGGIDKLQAPLEGRPLLRWSVEQMGRARLVRRLVVVVPPAQVERIGSAAWLDRQRSEVVAGGGERSQSVLAGVRASDAEIVLIHDGARPLATPRLADAVVEAVIEHGAAVPVVPVVDSLKRVVDGRVAGSVERAGLVRAQTPQGARRELLLKAFEATSGTSFGDEAAMLESHGVPVATVPGEPLNLKVTEPHDLELVRALLAGDSRMQETRRGIGHDSHPFGPADGLWLGGLLFEDVPRLHGHSDGDVALHALASALLAAAGLGDLGRLFPADDPSTTGIASSALLSSVLDRLGQAGWRPRSVQLALLGARPRLGGRRVDALRERVAELVGLDPGDVALTVSSGNLNAAEGAGLVISASAAVTIVRR